MSSIETTHSGDMPRRSAPLWFLRGWMPKPGVPAIVRRASARMLVCVMWALPLDRALAGVGLAIAVGSATFATTMILRVGSADVRFAQPQTPEAVGSATPARIRVVIGDPDIDPTGSIPRRDVRAGRAIPGPASPPAVNRQDPHEPPGRGVSSYVLRFADVGVALVEGPNGTFIVVPGSVVPEIGPVRSIEKRSGRWVVETATATIEEPAMPHRGVLRVH